MYLIFQRNWKFYFTICFGILPYFSKWELAKCFKNERKNTKLIFSIGHNSNFFLIFINELHEKLKFEYKLKLTGEASYPFPV